MVSVSAAPYYTYYFRQAINIGLATTKPNCPALKTDFPEYRIDYTTNDSHENVNSWGGRSGERATAAYLSARPY